MPGSIVPDGLKPKNLCGVPWRVALALQADGWYLRQDIIWAKPNPMPESCRDRCTKAHECLFLMSKRPNYYFDAVAIAEPSITPGLTVGGDGKSWHDHKDDLHFGQRIDKSRDSRKQAHPDGRNKRSVWTIATESSSAEHFAAYPTRLVEPCILAGTSAHGCCPACGAPWRRVVKRTPMELLRSGRAAQMGEHGRTQASGNMVAPPSCETVGWRPTCECNAAEAVPCTVMDPFSGTGTTGIVALRLGRNYVGIELKRAYADASRDRLKADAPVLNMEFAPA
jgi:hypothetical protein